MHAQPFLTELAKIIGVKVSVFKYRLEKILVFEVINVW